MATAIFFDAKLCLDEDSEYCPVRATLALLGQKWVPRIVYELMNGKRRFNELACAVGGCNSRTLRDRLKGLEELDIIERREPPTKAPDPNGTSEQVASVIELPNKRAG